MVIAIGLMTVERPTVAQSGLPRVTSLTYLGKFFVPTGQSGTSQLFDSFSYGGSALGYNAANNSLYIVGHVNEQLLAEISIPSLGGTATILQSLRDPTAGRLQQVNPPPNDPNSKRIGGTLVYGSNLLVSAYSYYDGLGSQALSHFVRSKTLSDDASVAGPFQVGTMTFCNDPNSSRRCGGFYSGYMGVVPSEWQAALGGPALTGNGSLGVISRTSYGPAIFAFDPNNISPTGAVPLLYYPESNRTLGPYEAASTYWGGSDTIRGVAIIPGTSTIAFFGRHGETYCYGYGTSDPALDRQPNPGQLDPFCYDPTDGAKGVHGYPYNSFVWLYDLNDLAAVRAGTRNPWSVLPYNTLKLNASMGAQVGGATIDPATGRIYVIEQFAAGTKDNLMPVIHVYQASFTPAPAEAPAISVQPVSATRPSGSSATFASAATGSPSPAFQWQVSTDGGATFTPLTDASPYSGTTTTALTIASVTSGMNGYRYRAIASNASGSATSTAAILTVSPPNAPAITTQPVNATVVEGSNVTFSTAASGSPTYQWRVSTDGGTTFNDVANTGPYSNATTANLTVTNVTTSLNTYRYLAVATNGSGSATSNAATLRVNAAGSEPPSISASPANVTVIAGASTTFSVTASGSPTYRWQLRTSSDSTYSDLTNTGPHSGVTTAVLTVTNATAEMSNNHYQVVATNAAGQAISLPGVLNVTTGTQAAVITAQPSNASVTPGSNATFAATASGSPSPTFQWQVSTDSNPTYTNLANSGPYSGVTTATLTVTGVTAEMSNNHYRVVATNASGPVTSLAGTLTVTAATQAPAVSAHPANASAAAGSNATFSVAASGSPAYQWQVSTNGGTSFSPLTNTAPYSGATTATLTITNVTAGLNGYRYRAVATNAAGSSDPSNAATLNVTAPVCTSFSISPTFATASSGSQVVTITGSPSGCANGSWTTVGDGTRITVSPASGSGSGAVTVSWSEQSAVAPRARTATIAGQTFTIVRGSVAPPSFSDDPITVGTTSVKAVHITELRQAVESLRSRYGLGTVTWTDAAIVGGTTTVRALHHVELRAAVQAVYTAAGATPPTYTRATVTAGAVITRQDLVELRTAILDIW